MDDTIATKQRSRGFNILFLTEIWERFGFYVVASILILYLTKSLGYNDRDAYGIFAVFSALLYLTPIVGGYLADRHIGYQRTLMFGVATLCAGYILLTFPYVICLYSGLSLIILGNGFFKSMPYALLGKLYQGETRKLDGRFTLYYLSINIGGIPAVIFGGIIGTRWGWNTAFSIAAVGLIVAMVTFVMGRRFLRGVGNELDLKPVATWVYTLIIIGILVCLVITNWLMEHAIVSDWLTGISCVLALLYLALLSRAFTQAERYRLMGALILIAFGIVFFAFFYQQPTSLTLFIDRNVTRQLFGLTIPSSSFWVLNPVWIIILGPLLNYFYKLYDPFIAFKFGFGIIIMSMGYFIVSYGTYFANAHSFVSAGWIVGSYFFQSFAELLISALGTAMIVKLVPKKIIGLMMGIWFFSFVIGGILAGQLASITAIPATIKDPAYSLQVYQHSFMIFGLITLSIGVIACAAAPFISKMTHAKD